MNKIYLTGKIKNIRYGLVDKGKIYAIAILKLKVKNSKNYITAICKNKNADIVYRVSKKDSNIIIEGYLRQIKKQYIVVIDIIESIF